MELNGSWFYHLESLGLRQKEHFQSLCSDNTRHMDLGIYSEERCCAVEKCFRLPNTRNSMFLGILKEVYDGFWDVSQRFSLTEEGDAMLSSGPLQANLKVLEDIPLLEFGKFLRINDPGERSPPPPDEPMVLLFSWLLSISAQEDIHKTSVHYCEYTQRHLNLRESWKEVQGLGSGIWEFLLLFSKRREHTRAMVVVFSLCIMARFRVFRVEWAKWRLESNMVEGFANFFKLLCADASRKVHEREIRKLRIDKGEMVYFRDLSKQIEQRYDATGERFPDVETREVVSWYGNEIRRCSAQISDFAGDEKFFITYLDIVCALLGDHAESANLCQNSKKRISIKVVIPGNPRPRYLDFNHFYCHCGTRLPIINGGDFSPAIVKRIVEGMKKGEYFQLVALFFYIVESLAIIVFTSEVDKFEKMRLSEAVASRPTTSLTEILVSLDEVVGFTRFWNEIRKNALDPKNNHFLDFIGLTEKFCLNFVERISEFGVHFQKSKVMRAMLPCCERMSELILALEYCGAEKLTPEVVEMLCSDMEKLLVELALIPCNSAAVTLSLYVEREIRPAVVSNRQHFSKFISETFVQSMALWPGQDAGKLTRYLLRTILRISDSFPEYTLPNRSDPRHPDNRETILKRVSLFSVLPNARYYLESFSVSGPIRRRWVCDYHLQLNYADLKASFHEFYCLLVLFALCVVLPREYLDPDIDRRRTRMIRFMQLWRGEETSEPIFSDLYVVIHDGALWPIIENLKNPQNTFFTFMYGRLMDMVRDLLFTESYKSDGAFNLKIREMASSGPFSVILCKGFVLIPRLRRWIQKSANLGLMIKDIHGDYILSHIEESFSASGSSPALVPT